MQIPLPLYFIRNWRENQWQRRTPSAVRLSELHAHTVQRCINGMEIYPGPQSDRCTRCFTTHWKRPWSWTIFSVIPLTKEIKPFDDEQTAALLQAVKGGQLEHLVSVALFTGLRLSELLGLTWDAVDFDKGTISINKQLARPEHRKAGLFISPKSGKARTITPAVSVFAVLKAMRRKQLENQLRAGPLWDNAHNLIFTNETGGPLCQHWITNQFYAAAASAGLERARFHDCRHTYARAGDNIKVIQGNLGHATAAFTLDRYAHFTEQLQQDSAARMEGFIKNVLNL